MFRTKLARSGGSLIAAAVAFALVSPATSAWAGHARSLYFDGDNNWMVKRFLPGEFSSLTLAHFPSDWEGYECLNFIVANRNPDAVWLNLKIHDRLDQEPGYDQQYNERLKLLPGENRISLQVPWIPEPGEIAVGSYRPEQPQHLAVWPREVA